MPGDDARDLRMEELAQQNVLLAGQLAELKRMFREMEQRAERQEQRAERAEAALKASEDARAYEKEKFQLEIANLRAMYDDKARPAPHQ